MAQPAIKYFEYEVNGISSLEFSHNIFRACYHGDYTEVVSALREAPECLNARDRYTGNTPLMMAASLGNYSIVELLLRQPGIDIRATNNEGKDAFDLSWGCGHGGVTKLIRDHLYPGIARLASEEPK